MPYVPNGSNIEQNKCESSFERAYNKIIITFLMNEQGKSQQEMRKNILEEDKDSEKLIVLQKA